MDDLGLDPELAALLDDTPVTFNPTLGKEALFSQSLEASGAGPRSPRRCRPHGIEFHAHHEIFSRTGPTRYWTIPRTISGFSETRTRPRNGSTPSFPNTLPARIPRTAASTGCKSSPRIGTSCRTSRLRPGRTRSTARRNSRFASGSSSRPS